MTEKARRILEKTRPRGIRQWSKVQANPVERDIVLNGFNKSTLDDVGPVSGGDQEIKVLKEMNELEEFQNENWSRENPNA